jgi:regulator of nucleoside diphosphate kinase
MKLQKMIRDILQTEVDGTEHVRTLDAELRRAAIVPAGQVPSDVITMHTKVLLAFDDGEDETYSLVYPNEADMSENMVSVLSPIGTAILGYRAGDVVEWSVPDGTVAIHVKSIEYQPEAAGDER